MEIINKRPRYRRHASLRFAGSILLAATSGGFVSSASAEQLGPARQQQEEETEVKVLVPQKAQADEPSDAKEVRERLQGDWRIVNGSNQGDKLDRDEMKDSHVVVAKNAIVVFDRDEKELYKARFDIEKGDREDAPWKINMVTEMPTAPKTLAFGIVTFTENGWKLAYGLPGADRPDKFESPEAGSPEAGSAAASFADGRVMYFELTKIGEKGSQSSSPGNR